MCPEGDDGSGKGLSELCTAAVVCGEVMVRFEKRRKKDEAYLDFFRYYRRTGAGRISEKQAGGCHRQ